MLASAYPCRDAIGQPGIRGDRSRAIGRRRSGGPRLARLVRGSRFDRVGRDDRDRRRRRCRSGGGRRVVDRMDGDGPCHRPVEHASGGRRDDRGRGQDSHQLLHRLRRRFRRRSGVPAAAHAVARLRPHTRARRGHRARRGPAASATGRAPSRRPTARRPSAATRNRRSASRRRGAEAGERKLEEDSCRQALDRVATRGHKHDTRTPAGAQDAVRAVAQHLPTCRGVNGSGSSRSATHPG